MSTQNNPSPPLSQSSRGSTSEAVVRIRHAGPRDLAFIYASWLRDARAADPGSLPDDLWFPAHRELINRILANPAVVALIAAPVDAPDQILGFIVAEPKETLLWVHVKEKFRTQGIARRLLQESESLTSPAAWWTPLSSDRLRNPRRTRQLRKSYALSKPRHFAS